MGAIEDEKVYGLKVRESASDGSDFGTPEADYRFVFLGEDGLLHLKDSSDVVTDIGAGVAPDDATYLVAVGSGSLSAEVVVGATPGGELGGTWASPTVDSSHAGGTHAATQAAAEGTAAGALAGHTGDTADAHDASAISILDTADDFTATDVEGALAELQADAEAHLADTSGAHAASAISFTPAGTIAATTVQAAIEEVASEAGGGGGDITTDPAWAAAGDLIVADGNDSAAILPVGDEDDVLTVVSGVPAWAPATGGGAALTVQDGGAVSVANVDDITFPVGTVIDLTGGAVSVREMPSGQVSVRAVRTSGNITLNSASWADVDTGLDLTIPARAGDVLLIELGWLLGNQNKDVGFNVQCVASGNYVDAGAYGPGLWASQGLSIYESTSGGVQYVVQSDDVSGGNVTLRLRYRQASAGARTLYANTDYPARWSVYLLGTGNVAGLDAARARRASGDVTVTSTSFIAVDAALDLVVPAQAGDVLLVSPSLLVTGSGPDFAFDAATMVSGSPVNYVSGGALGGVGGWYCITGTLHKAGAAIQYVVQSGDLSGGNVTLRLMCKVMSAGTRLVYAQTDVPLHWSVVNLRGGAARLTPAADRDLITSGSDLTTTSTSFVDVTGASVTLTTSARRCLVTFSAQCAHNTDTAVVYADVDLDGTRLSGVANGLVGYTQAGSRTGSLVISFITDVLTAGSHTFKPQWRTNFAGVATLYRIDSPIYFGVVELGA